MSQNQSDAFVFFGATGDLAYKQIFPALQALIKNEGLNIPVIGVAKSQWTVDQLRERAKDSLEKNGGVDNAAFDKLSSLLNYVDGDYGDESTYAKLRKVLGNAKHPLYYLAIPPVLFSAVVEGLSKAGCVSGARVVVEKPFGRDLDSARKLNTILQKSFAEEDIFRIDHFLGKESVQNLLYFRFANPIAEASWSRDHIASVQITMAEKFGVTGRGKLYDEEGAIRDVVQNHLLQVVTCLAMECPQGSDHQSLRDMRGELLKAVRTLGPSDVVYGQFVGYRNEPGVAADSNVETFAALRFLIDNERWKDVPFYVRSGKCLPVNATEVLVRFKPSLHAVLDENVDSKDSYFRFRLGPDEAIALGIKRKKPGNKMVGQSEELIVHESSADEKPPYERLLGDATRGDATLFAREDSVEAAWRIVDPILAPRSSVPQYEPNTWGPTDTENRVVPEGGWWNPSGGN